MSDIRFVRFSAPIAGIKDIYFTDVAEGFSISKSHIRPSNQIRTQDGTLISQSIYFNKKSISISGNCLTNTLISYFQDIFLLNETVTLTIYKRSNNNIEQTESTYLMKMASHEDSNDFISTARNFGIQLEEI